jgi:hypothetical protein
MIASKLNFSSFLVISSEMLLLFGNYRQLQAMTGNDRQ